MTASSLLLAAVCFVLAAAGPAAGADQAPAKETGSRPAFFKARDRRTDYAGPGRELPEPKEITEVRIGYFGPSDPKGPEGDMWRAAALAVEEANAQGGYQGKPFRLIPGWSENPWSTGAAQVTRMVYRDSVWAIIGGIDGVSTHLAEQVVAKARLVLVSPATSDKTVNLANVPWMFSCLPGDHLQAPALAAEISGRKEAGPLVIVSTNDHDSHLFAVEVKKCLARLKINPAHHFQCKHVLPDCDEIADRIARTKPGNVLIVADADNSARLVAALRKRGFAGTIFGGPSMGRRGFCERAGRPAEGVIFPLLYDPREDRSRFPQTFRARFKIVPDYAAAHTYDAVRLLIAAVRKAGLNRARIRDALVQASPWAGVTGVLRWDGLGANCRAVKLGTIQDGSPVALDARGRRSEDLTAPAE